MGKIVRGEIKVGIIYVGVVENSETDKWWPKNCGDRWGWVK